MENRELSEKSVRELLSEAEHLLVKDREEEVRMARNIEQTGPLIHPEKYERAKRMFEEILEREPDHERAKEWVQICEDMLTPHHPDQAIATPPDDSGLMEALTDGENTEEEVTPWEILRGHRKARTACRRATAEYVGEIRDGSREKLENLLEEAITTLRESPEDRRQILENLQTNVDRLLETAFSESKGQIQISDLTTEPIEELMTTVDKEAAEANLDPLFGERKSSEEMEEIAREQGRRVRSFGHRLLRAIDDKPDSNRVLSPLGLSIALGVLREGADQRSRKFIDLLLTPNGTSEENSGSDLPVLFQKLYEENPEENPSRASILRLATAIWLDFDLDYRPDFEKEVWEKFKTSLISANFQEEEMEKKIGKWLQNATDGLIDSSMGLSLRESDPYCLIINTVYFQGEWDLPFSEEKTEPGPFHPETGDPYTVPFMKKEEEFRYRETDLFQAVLMEFKGLPSRHAVVMLPAPESSPSDLVDEFSGPGIFQEKDSFDYRRGTLKLPRFRAKAGISLKEGVNLEELQGLFEPNAFPDIWKTGEEGTIGDIYHNTVLNVDENGVEAASATEAFLEAEIMEQVPFTMTVDRPFLFYVVDEETESVLFVASIKHPEPVSEEFPGETQE